MSTYLLYTIIWITSVPIQGLNHPSPTVTEEERARRIAEKSPFFVVRMKNTEIIENTNLSYTIHLKGDPMPEVTL